MKTENNSLQKSEIPTPLTLLQQAVEKGVDMQQLEKLMELQERWEKKEARKSFFDALSKFQNLVPVLKKGKTARIASQKGSFSYRYADLASITKAICKPLAAAGLSYRWDFEESNGKLKVICNVSHRDGHTERTWMEADKDNSGAKNDIQQKGSTQTYLQRYTLIGALGLSTADDDLDAKGHKTTGAEDDAESIYLQWESAVNERSTLVELTQLYLKEKKKVDSDERIQLIFKTRQEQLKSAKKPQTVMP